MGAWASRRDAWPHIRQRSSPEWTELVSRAYTNHHIYELSQFKTDIPEVVAREQASCRTCLDARMWIPLRRTRALAVLAHNLHLPAGLQPVYSYLRRKMGHGNSNKLYVTHAEHSGMFGQHTASSAGFKASVSSIALFEVYALTQGLITGSKRHRTLVPEHHSTAAP